jgi:hypothetical protein
MKVNEPCGHPGCLQHITHPCENCGRVAGRKYCEEGDRCPECNEGHMIYYPVEDCSCHISPPCQACVNNQLTCDACEWQEEE